jgi:hypothetical protein
VVFARIEAAEMQRHLVPVDQGVLRGNLQFIHGAPHRQQRRLQDVEGIDLLDGRRRDRKGDGTFPDAHRKLFAPFRTQDLGVGQPIDAAVRIEDDGSRNDRPG